MYRLVLVFAAVAILSFATITSAKSENSGQGNSGNSGKNSHSEQQVSVGSTDNEVENEAAASPNSAHGKPTTLNSHGPNSASSSATCDPNANWKNHGEYVSCVAHLHLGGATVSEAARSDVGKKHATGSGTLSPSPNASSSGEPEATPTATPEATSSGLVANVQHQVHDIVNNIVSLLAQLQELLHL